MKLNTRYLMEPAQIESDLKEKIVIITGPRQTGKTTFSKMINENYDYLNYDFNSICLI